MCCCVFSRPRFGARRRHHQHPHPRPHKKNSAEIWGWTLFTIGTQTVAAALFTAAGAYQMAVWAGQKHKRLVKLFDGKDGRPKYPKRWVMLPPLF